MKIELKEFQETALQQLLKELRFARDEARAGKPQAIILSSATGSGKTVTLTALLERVLTGDETHPADPEAVFLWLSDSPQLNQQSRDKMLAQSSVFRPHELVIVQPPFSQERFHAGRLYFLNTQKLSKGSLLTRGGEGCDFTIWQTIENTSQEKPDHLYLVIDEAHRGMDLTARQRREAQTIVQKFIFGDPQVGLSPVKLVIGMSATPERFARVIEGSTRTKREYVVPIADVQRSGLVKEMIVVFCHEGGHEADWSLLAEAAKRCRRFAKEWRKYSREQRIPLVEPVLVVQAEDGTAEKLSRTDLGQAVEVLEREMGQFGLNALAHCFQEDGPIQAGVYPVRKIEASKIQQDPYVRVVLFKMALSTGWDCPRAEVMMSFRRAQDHTSIAQLVGRMVRTPLARRIEGNELLNTVSLYLPHYDREGLAAIVSRLNDPENASPTEVVDGAQLVLVNRDPGQAAAFELLTTLPSYCVERIPKKTEAARLLRLARQLTLDRIAPDAWPLAKALVLDTISEELERLRSQPLFAMSFRKNQTIEVREVHIEAGEWKPVGDGRVIRIKATPENIEDLFAECGRMLGEGLHREFCKLKPNRADPDKARLELYGLVHDEAAWKRIEQVARHRLEELLGEFEPAIGALPTSRQEEYNKIRRAAKDPQPVPLLFPPSIEVRQQEPPWERHLYVDSNGRFGWKANSWEAAVLKAELADEAVVGWLRNDPRKPWSLTVPYELAAEHRPLYPDLIVFRRVGERLTMDILDPHDPGRDDAVGKAKGLARYAEKHGTAFGRIELIIKPRSGQLRRLDMNKVSVRGKVKLLENSQQLKALFEELG
ncbi:DEAD/DEAH box helicase [Planctomycetota bacterium]